jgi:ATP-dependent RNA helicase RhlE
VAQALYPVPSSHKVALLLELLRRDEIGNVIVFCRTKHRANRVAEKLEKQGVSTARIHGRRSQGQRTEALAGFRDGRYRVLVATDIVSRGIDVESLDHVLNFDVPAAPDDYIHRVGRTGRAGASGDAFTFVAPDEEDAIRAIERRLGHRIERRTVAGFDYAAKIEERLEIPLAVRLAKMREARRPKSGARPREHAPQPRERVLQPAAAGSGLGARRGRGR